MKIADIFTSLQGEGVRQGTPCLFIRLSGCNLSCRWCDTQYARESGTEMGCDAILEQVWRENPRSVCITGGEPLLQTEALLPLLASLFRRGIAIDIETNGTIDFTPVQPYAAVCMDVKCPSSGEKSDLSLLSKIRPEDSVKFVVGDEEDCPVRTGGHGEPSHRRRDLLFPGVRYGLPAHHPVYPEKQPAGPVPTPAP